MPAELGNYGEGKTMKGWGMAQSTGKIEDITVLEARIPEPGPGDVLVKMVAATTNPLDYKRASMGDWPQYPAFFGVDGAGVVEKLGEGVTTLAVGDRVHFYNDFLQPHGTLAQYSIVRAMMAVPIPEGVTFEEAAVTPCAGWTAYECLFDRLRVEAGKVLIVNAAAGGVGHYAVQLAVNAGVRVIAIASGEWCAKLKQMGAAHTIDYRTENIKASVLAFTNNQGADYALDSVDTTTAQTLMACLKYTGQMVHIAGTITPPEGGIFAEALTTHHVFIPGHYFHGDAEVQRFREMGKAFIALVASGKVKTHVSATIGFDGVRDQLLAQKGGTVKGKVLIAF